MKYKIVILIISAVVALLIHFPELISLSDMHDPASPFAQMGAMDVANEVGYLFVCLLFLFWVNTLIFRFNDPSRKIGWKQLALSFAMTWVINSLLGQTFIKLHEWFNIPAIDAMLHHYLHPLRDFIISCLVTGGCYIIHLILKQHTILVENQQLRTENLRNQYEALKNQLNPHMFFNSLNTLNSLIRESPQKAQHYTLELSKVLRYTLQSSDPDGVTLSTEIDFVRGYIFILNSRYEENLLFEIDIDPMFNDYRLPPMAIQILIENAVKHNEISTRKPLIINITTRSKAGQDTIIVSNPIQPKINKSSGTGIGIANLSKRYQLLFHQEISIDSSKERYTVELPLIKSTR